MSIEKSIRRLGNVSVASIAPALWVVGRAQVSSLSPHQNCQRPMYREPVLGICLQNSLSSSMSKRLIIRTSLDFLSSNKSGGKVSPASFGQPRYESVKKSCGINAGT